MHRRTILALAQWGLAALLWGGFAIPAAANTGLAFLHGTSNPVDAVNEYWTPEFVDAIREGLPDRENYLVVNCDFEQFMWDPAAVGCLAEQLDGFIASRGITDLVIITHSNGANVIRWLLSNPTWDSRYPRIIEAIRWVNTLAASSAGTPLANIVQSGYNLTDLIGWLLDFDTDAVRMQQTFFMDFLNRQYLYGTSDRPALPVGFWNVIGTDVDSALWDPDSYCGGYEYQLALEATQIFLDSCSDGFIDCASQEAAGSVWFRDRDVTDGDEPLSHQQSRRACFGLERVLRDDI